MHTIEITIQRKTERGWPVVVEQSATGSFLTIRSEGLLELTDDVFDFLKTTFDAREYGQTLGEYLFYDPKIRDAFVKARTESKDQLCVLLSIEAPKLRTLDWQRLCAPIESDTLDFLALNPRTPLSLYLPSTTDRRFPAIGQRDLRALIVVANPTNLTEYNLAEFEAEPIVASIRRALGQIPSDVLGAVDGAVGKATLKDLCHRLTAEHYSLLHIVAHGQVITKKEKPKPQRPRPGAPKVTESPATKETVLYLADEDNQVKPVSATTLLEELKRSGGARGLPHFTFLSTCESASPKAEADDSLGGLAQRLVRELGMPAVLAMTDKVTIDTAETLAENFYIQLHQHGYVDRALVEACRALIGRPDQTVPALYSRLGGRPLFSDTEDRELTNAEIAFGLDALEKLLPERAPILQKSFAAQAAGLRDKLGADRTALSKEAQQEREEALTAINATCEEVLDLNFRALALGQTPPKYDDRCPFPGLMAFQADDREFFFGREKVVEELHQKLSRHSFLAVLGASGSGKSSVVLAGLVPFLQQQSAGAGQPEPRLIYLTPGSDPGSQLENALTHHDDQPAVIVIDQFEELFTLCDSPSKRKTFIKNLLSLVELDSSPKIVITMRADFWGECAPYPDLKAEMQAHQELLAPMTTAELRSAMEQQARTVGLRFEADLSHTILAAVQDEPGAMPLLQHLLREMWKRRHGKWLLTNEYRNLGGIEQAIAHTADELFNAASPTEQVYLREIFTRLTQLLDEAASTDQELRDTRRRETLANIIIKPEDAPLVRKLVSRLADARLVVTSVQGETAGPTEVDERWVTVEVAHEALIRHWPRLRSWLEEDRGILHLRTGISQATQEWLATPDDPGLLIHRGSRLEDIEALLRQNRLSLNPQEQQYVEACIALREAEKAKAEEQRRKELEAAQALAEEQRRRTRIALGIGSVAVLAAIVALWFFGQAQQSATEAEASAATAEANLAEAQAQTRQGRIIRARQLAGLANEAIDPSIKLMLAREAVLTTWLTDSQIITQPFVTTKAYETLHEANSNIWGWEQQFRPPGHAGAVTAVAFSPDGQWIVTASADRTIRLLQADTLAETMRWQGHVDGVSSMALSGDGQRIVSGGSDGMVRLWAMDQPEPLAEWSDPSGEVRSVAISRDGRQIISGGSDGVMRQWVVNQPEPLTEWAVPSRSVWSVALSEDGHQIVSGGGHDGVVRLWAVDRTEPLAELIGHSGGVNLVALSGDGQRIVSGGSDGMVRLWAMDQPEPLAEWSDPSGEVRSVAISRDGRQIISGGSDGVMRQWVVNQPEPLTEWRGHGGWVTSVALSGDGQQIVSGDGTGAVRLWAVDQTEPLTELPPQTRDIYSVALSADGRQIVSGGDDGIVRLWAVGHAEPLTEWHSHRGGVYSVAISRDGQQIVSGGADGMVRLWAMDRKKPLAELAGHSGAISSVAISRDGQQIVSGGEDRVVRLWAVDQPEPLTEWSGHTGWISSVALSEDGQRIVSGGQDGMVRLWAINQTEPLDEWSNPNGGVLTVAISRDGQQVVSGGIDGVMRLWIMNRPEPLTEWNSNDARVNSVVFSEDGQQIISGNSDGIVRLWAVDHTEPLAEWSGHSGEVNSVALSGDDQTIVTGGQDGGVRLWVVDQAEPVTQWHGYDYLVDSVAFSRNGQQIVSGGQEGVRLWAVGQAEPLAEWNDPSGRVYSVVFRGDEQEVVSGGEDGVVRLWTVDKPEPLAEWRGHSSRIWSVAVSGDGQWIVSGGEDGVVRLWTVDKPEPLAEWSDPSGWTSSVSISRNGQRIVSGSTDGMIRLWTVDKPEPLAEWSGHSGRISSVVISSDGQQIVSGGQDGMVRLWAMDRLEPLAEWRGHSDGVLSVAFSGDGRQIVTGGEDGMVRLWAMDRPEPLAEWGHIGRAASMAFSREAQQIVTGDWDGIIHLWLDVDLLLQQAGGKIQREPALFSPDELEEFDFVVDNRPVRGLAH